MEKPMWTKLKVEISPNGDSRRHGEQVRFAMRKLQKMTDKDGLLKKLRQHEFYEKPSEKRRRKAMRESQNAARLAREKESKEEDRIRS